MTPGYIYTITKKIKLHTKPLVEIVFPQTGLFVKETAKYFCFRGFRVRKDCVVQIKEEFLITKGN